MEKVENKLKNMEGNLNRNTEKNISGLQLAKGFYEEYGVPMIAEKFKEYEDKIAVGFVGEGSERFGFDDIYSRDHDFGPGFSMWVTKSTYDLIVIFLQFINKINILFIFVFSNFIISSKTKQILLCVATIFSI